MVEKRQQTDNSLMIVAVVAIVAILFIIMFSGSGINLSFSEGDANIAGQRPGLASVDRHCGRDTLDCTFDEEDKFCDENGEHCLGYEMQKEMYCELFPDNCGCTDPEHPLYDGNALFDDGSCVELETRTITEEFDNVFYDQEGYEGSSVEGYYLNLSYEPIPGTIHVYSLTEPGDPEIVSSLISSSSNVLHLSNYIALGAYWHLYDFWEASHLFNKSTTYDSLGQQNFDLVLALYNLSPNDFLNSLDDQDEAMGVVLKNMLFNASPDELIGMTPFYPLVWDENYSGSSNWIVPGHPMWSEVYIGKYNESNSEWNWTPLSYFPDYITEYSTYIPEESNWILDDNATVKVLIGEGGVGAIEIDGGFLTRFYDNRNNESSLYYGYAILNSFPIGIYLFPLRFTIYYRRDNFRVVYDTYDLP